MLKQNPYCNTQVYDPQRTGNFSALMTLAGGGEDGSLIGWVLLTGRIQVGFVDSKYDLESIVFLPRTAKNELDDRYTKRSCKGVLKIQRIGGNSSSDTFF
jgi:hypothetical protein